MLEGPGSIAHAFNNVVVGNQTANPPLHERKSVNTSIGVSHAARAREESVGTGDAVATSSKVRVEDMKNAKDEEDIDMEEDDDEDDAVIPETETTDLRRARAHADMVSRKVRWWADKLKEIRHAQVESLFEEEIVRDLSYQPSCMNADLFAVGQAPISAREVLDLLKDVDEHKNWATRVEVEDARLERLLNVLRNDLRDGSDANKLAIKILDNFAQRFRGTRYPPGRR
jgi:hypothetical protein